VISARFSVRTTPLGAQVAQRLRAMILRSDLQDGTRLLEEDLASQFDVSRGPIRDALKQLEREGLVTVRNRAAHVVAFSSEDIRHLYELRKALELLAVNGIARQAKEEQFARMHTCVDHMREAAQAGDHAAFAAADVAFHGFVVSLSANRRLSDVWYQYVPILATLLESAVGQEDSLHNSAEDHHTLLEMISSSDDRVVDEVSSHIDRACERMINSYERLSGTEAFLKNLDTASRRGQPVEDRTIAPFVQ